MHHNVGRAFGSIRLLRKLARLIFSASSAVIGMTGNASAAAACDLKIVNVNIYTAPQSRIAYNMDVVIDDGNIVAIRRSDRLSRNECAHIDGTGKFLVAGFWNSHVHLTSAEMVRLDDHDLVKLSSEFRSKYLNWGFTTVVDLASTTKTAKNLQLLADTNRIVAPNILTVGDPFYPENGTPIYVREAYKAAGLALPEVTSPAQAKGRVLAQRKEGVHGIKLFTGAIVGGKTGVLPMEQDTAQAIGKAARSLNIPTFAHASNKEGLDVALKANVNVLAHALPLMGAWDRSLAKRLVDHDVAMIPTLSLFERFPHPRTPVAVAQQQVRMLHQSGGQILFGTDAGFVEDYSPIPEYRLMSEVIGWRDILASLTTNPARLFGLSERYGAIRTGYRADLVMLDSDPAADPMAFGKIAFIIKSGIVVRR